jgi:hypothetical protein
VEKNVAKKTPRYLTLRGVFLHSAESKANVSAFVAAVKATV